MTHTLELPERLPAHVRAAHAFRATPFQSPSRLDPIFERTLAARLQQGARTFGIESAGIDEGARTVFRERTHRLHVYHASDSLWWVNENLGNQETFPAEGTLPGEREAALLAALHFGRLNLDASAASFASVDFSEASIQSDGEPPRVFRTAVNANYRFTLDGLPVFGPGAKIKMSFSERGQLAQVIYFWRKPCEGESLTILPPEEALERIQRDPRLARLGEPSQPVKIRSIELGYYALSPADFQRFYIPVYAIDATVRTREFAQHDFRLHISAVRTPASEGVMHVDALATEHRTI